ncbi:MAG: response regulator [Sphingomonas sp.]
MTTPKDPLRYFRVEAREISEELGRGALQIEKGATPEVVARMMRLAHTLKGAASVVKQRAIAENTHALEDALAPLREGGGAASRAAIETILGHVDAIAAQVAGLAEQAEPARRAAPAADGAVEEPAALPRAELAEMDALLDGIAEVSVQLGGMRRAIDRVEQARHLADLLVDSAGPQSARHARAAEGSAEKTRQFAEDLQRLVAGLEQELKASVDQSERDIQQAHGAAERLRLVPCGTVFAALERAARDSAHALGKQAAVTVKGGEVRLDAQVLGLVQRALVQLLRNAVAHGIEPPAARRAAGKLESGAITIEVERRGNRVAFVCADDGAGIDLEAVRRAADARGLLPEGWGGASGELLDLLLKGGFSTSSAVTEASGRGVGLDVVREIAAQLGGEIRARTAAGAGTRVELVVPVSLAALDALLVEIGDTVAAIPLGSVRRALRLAPGDIAHTAERDSIVHDGSAIAFVPLARAMRAAAAPASAQAPRSAVVVDGASALAAVGIDRLLGAANVVVRPVPALAFADPVVAGMFLDARGIPRAVIDPDALVRTVSAAPGSAETVAERPPPILVIDDSLTTRVLEQSILESAGYEVDLATSAEEGLEKARRRRYGLFLVDVEMPGMDGFTFVATTRADPELHRIPAILVTSRNAPEDRQRGIDAGARAYVVKSEFDQGKVLETIRGLLEES